MISAFVNRRPWAAVVMALVFSPLVGMFYLGRGRWGLAYLLLTIGAYGLLTLVAHFGLLPVSLDAAIGCAALIVAILGAVHCHRIAARLDQSVPRVWFARWYGLLAVWVSPVVLAFAIRTLLWEPFYIPAASMEPNLSVGDYLFVSKYAYRVAEPRRGDIVVFLPPSDNATAYVKRLIGLPGDKVQMKAGSLYLNGERIPRREAEQRPEQGFGEIYREVLPGGRSYLIREISDHMRFDNTDVYEVPAGHYFFLGDNRDNSLDSRLTMGFVPRENLIGPLTLIYWNSEAQRLRLFDEE